MSDDAAAGPRGRRFRVREGLAFIAPDRWIEDDHGERAFQVDEMALAKLSAFILRDLHGIEVAKLEHEDLRSQKAADIFRQGAALATVRRARAGLRHHYDIESPDAGNLEVHGHIGRYDYEIRRGGDVVATISKDWSRPDAAYGVEVSTGEDEAMLVAAAVAIESLHTG